MIFWRFNIIVIVVEKEMIFCIILSYKYSSLSLVPSNQVEEAIIFPCLTFFNLGDFLGESLLSEISL